MTPDEREIKLRAINKAFREDDPSQYVGETEEESFIIMWNSELSDSFIDNAYRDWVLQ